MKSINYIRQVYNFVKQWQIREKEWTNKEDVQKVLPAVQVISNYEWLNH